MAIIKRIWWISFYPSYTYKRTGSRLGAIKLLAFASAMSALSDY